MGSLMLVAGYAGIGKSTYAWRLATVAANGGGQDPAPVLLDKDIVAGPLVAVAMTALTGDPDDRESAAYVDQVKSAEYQAFTDAAVLAAAAGASVLAVAPWTSELADPARVAALEQRCGEHGIRLGGWWLTCDPETHLSRLRARNSPRDRPKLSDPEAWFASLAAPPLPSWMTALDISATFEPEAGASSRGQLPSIVGGFR